MCLLRLILRSALLASRSCLLVSALLTAIYMLSIVRRAYLTDTGAVTEAVGDPGWQMCLPLILCAAASALLGLFSQPLMELLQAVAWGML